MSNPDETTTEIHDNIVPMAGVPENQPPLPPARADALFAKTVNDAVNAAQAAGVDQATIYGILHFISIQVEAPIRIIAHKNGQRSADIMMGRQ